MRFDRSKLATYLSLYLVSDRTWLLGRSLQHDVQLAIEGGVRFVQLREKGMQEDAFIEEAWSIKAICEQAHIPFVINDNVMVAKKVEADGVHVGQKDMSVREVRQRVGDHMIIGVSAQNVQDAIRGEKEGADYIGVGAIFSTQTKQDADHVSISVLHEICSSVQIPVIAIGGIDVNNVKLLQGSGIKGIAVVSAILGAPDIREATRVLYEKVKEVLV